MAMLLYNGNNKGGIMKKFLNILLVFFAVGGLFTVLFFGIYGAVESTKTAIDEIIKGTDTWSVANFKAT